MSNNKTVREIAIEYRQSEATVLKWIREGKLPAYRPGRKFLVKQEDLQRFIHESRMKIQQDPDVKALIKGMFRKTA